MRYWCFTPAALDAALREYMPRLARDKTGVYLPPVGIDQAVREFLDSPETAAHKLRVELPDTELAR